MPRVLNKRTDVIPKDAVYVGRPTKWGNPYVIGVDGTREEVIEKYRYYLMGKDDLIFEVNGLKGKDLVCWCSPEACHADVLLEIANETHR